jgi:translation initiation factor IF-2
VTQQPGGSGPDLIGEFQRWLIRSSARGVGRQVSGQIRSALGRNQQQSSSDVWETATAEPPDEAPECAWCPLCRAARLLRESKAGRDTRVTAVSDALGGVVQDAFSVLEAALAATGRAGAGDARRAGTAGAAAPRPGTARPGTDGKPAAAKQRPASATGAAQPKPGDRTAKAGEVPGDGARQPSGSAAGAAQPKPGDRTAKAGEVPGDGARQPSGSAAGAARPKAADGTAKAGHAPGGGTGKADHATDVKPTTAESGPAGHAAKPAPAGRREAGRAATDRGPGERHGTTGHGTAGQGPGEEPAAEPPGESLDEPDDRG